MKLGQRLKNLRNKRGLSQYEVAEKLGIQRGRYNSWENNIAKPRFDMLEKLCDFFKVDINEIVGNEPVEHHIQVNKNDLISGSNLNHSKTDFKVILEDDSEILFNGVPLSKKEKEKVLKVMEAMLEDDLKED
ncbi:helix-turn-helix domain-containing protein [Chengkuizengella sp. SCS-71B]|uniref:helix-turn-helix domain-containing protein n=1 Tax=Chengkuizengella sp. SCS-71B TaxID=3115290 RepID=UPI0032C2470C